MLIVEDFHPVYKLLYKSISLSLFTTFRFAAGAVVVASFLFSILFIQTVLILSSSQRLFAVPNIPLDPSLAANHPLEQGADCTVASYQAQPGDTIAGLADRAHTTSERVRECNNLSSDVVYAGQTLSLPGEVDNNPGTTLRTRVTRTHRATPPATNRYQGSNNGNGPAYSNGRRHASPPQRRRPLL